MSNKEKNSHKIKKPWPTRKVMEQIYEMKLWGGNQFHFYSGEGSHNPIIVKPYIKELKQFLNSFEKPITVCDLGCGDFNIGKELVKHSKKYIAIDIVEELIAHNKRMFKILNLEFFCMDIAIDTLPIADCVLLRQVLQHLSNSEIQNIISKLYSFKYVILTEHLPCGEFVPNKNIIAGQGIRLKKNSGIDLLSPPFNFKVKEKKQLTKIDLGISKGVVVTMLYIMK